MDRRSFFGKLLCGLGAIPLLQKLDIGNRTEEAIVSGVLPNPQTTVYAGIEPTPEHLLPWKQYSASITITGKELKEAQSLTERERTAILYEMLMKKVNERHLAEMNHLSSILWHNG